MTDARIIEEIRAGNTERYEILVERYLPLVRSVCGTYEFNTESRDDLVQDSFIDGYLNLNRLRNPGRFAPWLTQIARNKCKNWVRKQKHHRDAHTQLAAQATPHTDSTPLTEASRKELREWMHTRIHELPLKTRTAMLLFYMEGFTIEEVVRQLNVHDTAIKKRLQYGREQLGEKLCADIRAQERIEESLDQKKRIITAIPLASAAWLKGAGTASATSLLLGNILSSWFTIPLAGTLILIAALALPPLLETELKDDTLEPPISAIPVDAVAQNNTDNSEIGNSTEPATNTSPPQDEPPAETGSLTVNIAYEMRDENGTVDGPPILGATVIATPMHLSIHPNLIAFVEENGFTDEEIRFVKNEGASLFGMAVKVSEGESAEEKLNAPAASLYSIPKVEIIKAIRSRLGELSREGKMLPDEEMMLITYEDNQALTGITDNDGSYLFVSLPTGQYKIESAILGSQNQNPAPNWKMAEIAHDIETELSLLIPDTISTPKGIVIDKDSGKPLEGVSVTIAGEIFNGTNTSFDVETNEKGEFYFDSYLPFMKYGAYTLETEQSEFFGPVFNGIRELGVQQRATLEAIPSAVIYGRILNADGLPAAGVVISRQNAGGTESNGVEVSDVQGKYRVAHDGGIVTLYASKGTSKTDTMSIELDRYESFEHDFVLPMSANVYLTLHDEDGKTPMTIHQGHLNYMKDTNSKSSMGGSLFEKLPDGRFVLSNLRAGEYTVSMAIRGYQTEQRSFSVDETLKPQSIDVPLKTGTLSVGIRVVDENEKPLINNRVSVGSVDEKKLGLYSTARITTISTDENGRCVAEQLWPGKFTFSCHGETTVATLPHSGEILLTVKKTMGTRSYSLLRRDLELFTADDTDRKLSMDGAVYFVIRPSGGISTTRCEPGINEIYCIKSGYTAGSALLNLNADGKRASKEKIRVTLGTGGSMFGTVTDEKGNPVEGENLYVYPARIWDHISGIDSQSEEFGRSLAQNVKSDTDGTFWLDYLPEGQYYIHAGLHNGLPSENMTGPFDVLPGLETGSISLILKQE